MNTQPPQLFAEIIIPLAAPGRYTYSIPAEEADKAKPGCRVEVVFGRNKTYAGLIYRLLTEKPTYKNIRPVVAVLDSDPVVSQIYLHFWEWIWEYYCCEPGEVMNAAMPSGLKLDNQIRIILHPDFTEPEFIEDDEVYLILEALHNTPFLKLSDIELILSKKHVMKVLKKMQDNRLIKIEEIVKEKYKPKLETYVRLSDKMKDEDAVHSALNELSKAPKQEAIILLLLAQKQRFTALKKSYLLKRADTGISAIQSLVEKGFIIIEEREVSRLDAEEEEEITLKRALNEKQEEVLKQTELAFENQKPVLLHGVTGSGKTEVYIELIKKALKQDNQVLYLLPEIALTAQMVARLKKHFGSSVFVYHSKFSVNERTEIWLRVRSGEPMLIVGARSALWLPMENPGLIIVDEEHDASFKQHDPAPRYNCRDAALYLAHQLNVNILLGSATPSLESMYNAQQEKFHLLELKERFGDIEMPKLEVVSIVKSKKDNNFQYPFTGRLLQEIHRTIEEDKQVILFQNRRGFAPTLNCNDCGWIPDCINCDVLLSYHKFINSLQCHYCSYKIPMPPCCPECQSINLSVKGFGTERIEEDISIHFKDEKVLRLDQDTTRSKKGGASILSDFAAGDAKILVGTQMVTKGLDFENVHLVGILFADQLWSFGDFRSEERAYQLMVQVAGRAGRKGKQGKVIIQTYKPMHKVIQHILMNNYNAFVEQETAIRKDFFYPPFSRVIKLTFRHKDFKLLDGMTFQVAKKLRRLDSSIQVLGPTVPVVSRIRGQYLRTMFIKIPKQEKKITAVKTAIRNIFSEMQFQFKTKSFEMIVDVDPA